MRMYLKKTLCLVICLWAVGFMNAQTQQGLVKTRGRMVNGVVQPGQGLQGATIQVKDRSAVLSGNNGKFSIALRANTYLVQSVKKQGYQLVDVETCRDYRYSESPLYIVMETPEQQLADELEKAKKLRREMQRKLDQREDEIAALNVSLEERNRLMQEVGQQREDNEKIIKDLAQYYATLDYDQLDAFQQQVSACLEEGLLEKADSLLRSRGDISSRIKEVKGEQDAEAKEAEELARRKKQLEESQAGTRKKVEELAADCNSFHLRFRQAHRNDSAAHYLELRAELDTTNVEWQEDAAEFILEYLSDPERAYGYHLRALRNAMKQQGEQSELVAIIKNNIGGVYMLKNDNDSALSCFQEALQIQQSLLPADHEDIALSYKNIAMVYDELDEFAKALDFMQRALNIYEQTFGPDDLNTAKTLSGIGAIHSRMGEYEQALDYYNRALAIHKKKLSDESLELAGSYNNLGSLNIRLGNNDKALEYLQKALHIFETVMGNRHPDVATVSSNIGSLYKKTGELQHSLEYHLKALQIREGVLGQYHHSTAVSYNNIGSTYMAMDSLQQAMSFHEKALESRKHCFGARHTSVAESYNNIGQVLVRQGDRKQALDYYAQALSIFEEKLGTTHPSVGVTRNNMGMCYKAMGDYAHAVEYLTLAVGIFEQRLGADHLQTQRARQNLKEAEQLQNK